MKNRKNQLLIHVILAFFTISALFPSYIALINSLKTRIYILDAPLTPPSAASLSFDGYTNAFEQLDFILNLTNSLIVTASSLFLTLLFGAMAAFALTEYQFRTRRFIYLIFIMGIMVPIRIATVGILDLMVFLKLVNTLLALILVYTASGLPFAIFILSEFAKGIPNELKNAGRMDGMGEISLFFKLILPLLRPGLASVAIYNVLPIWNDIWFPLILAPGEQTKTVTLGAQIFMGQFQTDWRALLAALSLAASPILFLYVILSKSFLKGFTAGAIK